MRFISVLKSYSMFLVFLFHALSIQLTYAEAPQDIKGSITVSVLEAYALHQKGAVFIDVRDAKSWNSGHVEGSLNLDFTADEFVALYSNQTIDRATPIVFYCDSPLHNASAMASYFAAEWGYTNVYYFRDGFYSWLAIDAPMTMGSNQTYLTKHVEKTRDNTEI